MERYIFIDYKLCI